MNKKTKTMLMWSLIGLVIALPSIVRYGSNSLPIGEYAYHHLAQAQSDMWAQNFYTALLHNIPSPEGAIAINWALTMVFLIVMVGLLKKNSVSETYQWITLGLLAIAPTTLYMATYITPYTLTLTLLAGGLYLTETRYKMLSPILLLPLLYFDGLTMIVSVLVVGSYSIATKKHIKKWWVMGITAIMSIIIVVFPRPLVFEHLPRQPFLIKLLTDLGSAHGIALVTVILGIMGAVIAWKHKKILWGAYGLVVALIGFTMMNQNAILFLAPLVILAAGKGGLYFWKRRWSSSTIKFLTLAVIVCSILFSSISYADRIISAPPGIDMEESFIELQDEQVGNVLSHPQKGFWIEYASYTPFITYESDEFINREETANSIFHSRDLNEAAQLLEENDITHIWIDKEMKSGQVWKEKEEGILFLFRNERFKRIYFTEDVELWRFE